MVSSCIKNQLFETSGLQFDNWLLGPEKFSGLSRNRPLLTDSFEIIAETLDEHS